MEFVQGVPDGVFDGNAGRDSAGLRGQYTVVVSQEVPEMRRPQRNRGMRVHPVWRTVSGR